MNEANAARCAAMQEKGIVPTLAVVRVGARPDDLSYEKGVLTRCGKVGVAVKQFLLPEDAAQDALLESSDRSTQTRPSTAVCSSALCPGSSMTAPSARRWPRKRTSTASRTVRWPVCSPTPPSATRLHRTGLSGDPEVLSGAALRPAGRGRGPQPRGRQARRHDAGP